MKQTYVHIILSTIIFISIICGTTFLSVLLFQCNNNTDCSNKIKFLYAFLGFGGLTGGAIISLFSIIYNVVNHNNQKNNNYDIYEKTNFNF